MKFIDPDLDLDLNPDNFAPCKRGIRLDVHHMRAHAAAGLRERQEHVVTLQHRFLDDVVIDVSLEDVIGVAVGLQKRHLSEEMGRNKCKNIFICLCFQYLY